MKTVLFSTAAVFGVIASQPAFAESPAPDAGVAVGELVVTATRTPQAAERIGQSVSVLTAEDLRRAQAVVVSDALATLPGVSFNRNGGVGGVTTVRLRGAEAGHTVVLVDGVRLNDPSATDAAYNFANLIASDIARIEVLRGAQSTLWGSQAIGGVVNIITAAPSETFAGEASLEGGSMETAEARAAVGGTTGHLAWRLAASEYKTGGVSSYAKGAEADGYRNTRLSGRATLTFTEALSLDLRGSWSRGRNDYDGFPAPLYAFADTAEYGITKDRTLYGGLNFALAGGRLKNRLAIAETITDRDTFNPDQAVTTRTYDSRGETRRSEYQGAFDIGGDWSATFGAEREKTRFRSASPSAWVPNPAFARAEAQLDSLYLQVLGPVAEGLTLTLGVRRDDHDAFGDHTVGQAALAWSLNDGATVVRASFGQGFKAPTLYQLYSDYGNLGLKPETADAWDLGVEHRIGAGTVSATVFRRETEDQIDYVSCAATATTPLCFKSGARRYGYYDNIAQATAQGLELGASGKLAGVDLSANYTWTDTENGSAGANHGKVLARRPEHMGTVQADYAFASGLKAGVTVRYVGASFDNAANSYELAAHTLVDLRASYPVNGNVEVYGRVQNLLDETYETTRNYGVQGRAAYVGVRARF